MNVMEKLASELFIVAETETKRCDLAAAAAAAT